MVVLLHRLGRVPRAGDRLTLPGVSVTPSRTSTPTVVVPSYGRSVAVMPLMVTGLAVTRPDVVAVVLPTV